MRADVPKWAALECRCILLDDPITSNIQPGLRPDRPGCLWSYLSVESLARSTLEGHEVPTWNPPDMAFTVNKLPKGLASGSLFRMALQVDPRGIIVDCGVAAQPSLELAALFCREAAAKPAVATLDENGTQVASVQEFIVRLSSQQALNRVVKRLRQR